MATFRNNPQVLAEVVKAYEAASEAHPKLPANPHLWSSTMWEAWEAGWHTWMRGVTKPEKARATRGGIAILTAGGGEWKASFTYHKGISHSKLDRL